MRLILVVIFLLTGCSKITLQPGQQIPRMELYGIDGQMDLLEFYRGSSIKMLFWSHRCGHSVRALKKFSPSREADILMTISIDDINDKDKVDEILKDFSHTKNYFSGNGLYDSAWNAVGGLAVPAILYVSPDLRLLKVE